MSGGSPVKQPRRPSLLPALSGRLSGAGAGAGVTGSGLDPALRAALSAAAHSKTRAPGAPFAAPWSGLAGADRARSDATLQLLRQLSKPTPASATEQSPPRPRADSACVTESTEGDSACSSQGAGVGSVGRAASPFAAAPPAVPPLSAEMLRGLPSPPAASPSVASTAADTAYHSAAGGAPHSRAASSYDGPADTYHWEEGPGPPSGGGADTPRSAVSWYSLRSGMAALPQTEAELAQLDLGEVVRLAAEAAELQERAGAALRLARQRLQGEPGARSGSGDGQAAGVEGGPAPASARSGSPVGDSAHAEATRKAADLETASEHKAEPALGRKAAAAAPATPALLLLALQLLLLLTAAAEAGLLWCAGAARRASGGTLRVPRSLVLAPVGAARGGAVAALLAADVVLALLAPRPSRRAS